MKTYCFRPDHRMADFSYKQRIDDLIESCRRIAIACCCDHYDKELLTYLSSFAETVPVQFPPSCATIVAERCDSILWQQGVEYLEKQEVANTIASLRTMLPIGIIEVHNFASNLPRDPAHRSTWYGNDFTMLGLDWRYFGPVRIATNRLIGYWSQ
jgi:hypothetical protein